MIQKETTNIVLNIYSTDNLNMLSIYIVMQIKKYNHVCSFNAKSVRTEKMLKKWSKINLAVNESICKSSVYFQT